MIKVNYKNSLVSVSNSILNYYGVKTFHNTQPLLDGYLKEKYNHIVVILIDGMGINILNEHLSEDALLRKHYKTTISSVFPPTTVAATNAFLSAKMPYETGFLGWTQYNELDDLIETVFLEEDSVTFEKTKIPLMRQLNYQNFLTLVNKENPNVEIEEIYIKPIKGSNLETFKQQLDRALMKTFSKKSLTYLYYPLLDSLIHEYGTKDEKIKNHLNEINDLYEQFTKEVGDDTLIITISDHGFTDIEFINLREYEEIVKTLKRDPSIEGRAMTFFVKKGYQSQFKKLFNKYFKTDFKLIKTKKALRNNIFGFGRENYLLKTFLGDYLAIATSNKAFNLSENSKMAAHHGGSLKKELDVPLIINR